MRARSLSCDVSTESPEAFYCLECKGWICIRGQMHRMHPRGHICKADLALNIKRATMRSNTNASQLQQDGLADPRRVSQFGCQLQSSIQVAFRECSGELLQPPQASHQLWLEV